MVLLGTSRPRGELEAPHGARPLGPRTLESLFDAWIAAGVELRAVVLRRATLTASLGREGTAIDECERSGGLTQRMCLARP